MGNCHAVDPAAATVEYPSGKVERLYFPSPARQLMLQHPGHYVALLPPPPPPSSDGSVVNVKRKLKLLPPDAILNVGYCYRLVSFEDVLSELSERGTMAHHTSRKGAHANTQHAEKQHASVQPLSNCKEKADIRRSAKHMNQLRAMLTKSFVKEDTVANGLYPIAAPTRVIYSSIQSSIQPMHSMHRGGGTWRPSLQSIAERGR